MKTHQLVTTTIINKPLSEVFDFFKDAGNLNRLTPPSVQFKILTPLPIEIKRGTLIDYSIKINGIPFKWQTEICIWEPPYRFMDQQIKGPYKVWRHEHKFEEIDGITHMTDTVDFLSPGWILEPLINQLYIKHKVKEIFDYRAEQIKIWANE
jgi:ligand-binding SRPBCC domain-containing protein